MENMNRIQRVSRGFRLLCTVAIVALPVGAALFWGWFNQMAWPLPQGAGDLNVTLPLSTATLVASFAISMIPLAVVMFGLLQLRRLFELYGHGTIFAAANARCLRRLGWTLIVWMLADVVFDALISVALTLGNPPGQRQLSISLAGADLTALFLGGVILIISWVMDEAGKMAADHAEIV
jgi:hypothetical protein